MGCGRPTAIASAGGGIGIGMACGVASPAERLAALRRDAALVAAAAADAARAAVLRAAAVAEARSYELKPNYARAAGDTYFGGKLLAKLGMLSLVAEQLGEEDAAADAAARLAVILDRWLGLATEDDDGSGGGGVLLYDAAWGGVVPCGCDYVDIGNEDGVCSNDFAAGDSCPNLDDVGADYGR